MMGRAVTYLITKIPTSLTMSQRAPFIVIEGLDRSGKTTQTYRLHETLKSIGVEAISMKFPGKHFIDVRFLNIHGKLLSSNLSKIERLRSDR